jgi:adenosylmethionine-8-amino-7-oxononanoate aminotransferase
MISFTVSWTTAGGVDVVEQLATRLAAKTATDARVKRKLIARNLILRPSHDVIEAEPPAAPRLSNIKPNSLASRAANLGFQTE